MLGAQVQISYPSVFLKTTSGGGDGGGWGWATDQDVTPAARRTPLQGGPLGPSKFSSFSPVGPQCFLSVFRLLASSVLN